jgi:prevent-host-death family protein
MAITAGVRELKNRLTHYLKLVQKGERVIVTDRKRPVAILGPLEADDASETSLEERLGSLAREGGLTLGEPRHRLEGWKAVSSKGKPASRIISRDRDSR